MPRGRRPIHTSGARRFTADRGATRDELRTNLWLVPALLVVGALAIFAVTYAYDTHQYAEQARVPQWLNMGGADAGRQLLIALAAAVITVVGVVFSVTIVALTLASSQFGPRMLRNFIRDRTTQLTLGVFVATFVYAILALGSIGPDVHGDFVPHLSIAVTLGLVLIDLLVLIYFIHHVAVSIQLPQVIAGIASDLRGAIDDELPSAADAYVPGSDAAVDDAIARVRTTGATVPTGRSGYLQYVSNRRLVRIASQHDAVVELLARPGHFVSENQPLARVFPAEAAGAVGDALHGGHVTGPQRTLSQDMAFAIDQLVEIAIRALSPAVNDTFTAMNCIDWLADGLVVITQRWVSGRRLFRDGSGAPRVLGAGIGYDRLLDRAYDKIRQAGRGMPAVLIRQLDGLAKVRAAATSAEHLAVIDAQARLVRAAGEAVPDPSDRADVEAAYQRQADAALVL